MRLREILIGVAVIGALSAPAWAADPGQVIWKFDNLKTIGGQTPKVEGRPEVINTPAGKAILFHGSPDGLFFGEDPIAGFKNFSFEALFRPDGGPAEQRWFHLAETDAQGMDSPLTGVEDSHMRFTYELRVADNHWYLESLVRSKTGGAGLTAPAKVFPVGQWYTVAQTYDGKTYRSFVNGELQAERDINYTPLGAGHASVGMRINRIYYFQGAVMEARFTPQALSPDELLKVPANLNTAKTP